MDNSKAFDKVDMKVNANLVQSPSREGLVQKSRRQLAREDANKRQLHDYRKIKEACEKLGPNETRILEVNGHTVQMSRVNAPAPSGAQPPAPSGADPLAPSGAQPLAPPGAKPLALSGAHPLAPFRSTNPQSSTMPHAQRDTTLISEIYHLQNKQHQILEAIAKQHTHLTSTSKAILDAIDKNLGDIIRTIDEKEDKVINALHKKHTQDITTVSKAFLEALEKKEALLIETIEKKQLQLLETYKLKGDKALQNKKKDEKKGDKSSGLPRIKIQSFAGEPCSWRPWFRIFEKTMKGGVHISKAVNGDLTWEN